MCAWLTGSIRGDIARKLWDVNDGMVTGYRVTLEKTEREQLLALTTTGETNARRMIHTSALLLCDVGPPDN